MSSILYELKLKMQDAVTRNLKEIEKTFTGVKSIAKNTNSEAVSFSKILKEFNSQKLVAINTIVQNTVSSFAQCSTAGIEFEQSMADLSSITGITGEDLSSLSDNAREMGISAGIGAKGAADSYAILASQIDVATIGMEGLNVLQKDTITLAQAGGVSMEQSATALAGTMNQFGLAATESSRVINVLAAGSKYGAAEIADLSMSFKTVGAAANAAGLSVEDTAGAIEVLSKNNLKGAEAGTALRNMILKMQIALGADFTKNSLSEVLEALKPKLNDATYLAKIFGIENLAAAQFMITNSAAVEEMTAKVTATNVAQEQAAIRMDTTAEKMKKMQAWVDNVKISFFDLSNGLFGYLSVLGDSAVMISQLIPLFSKMGSMLKFVSNIQVITTAGTKALTVADLAHAGAQKILAASMWLVHAAMNANPFVIVGAAVAALVAVLVTCYNQFEGFRNVVNSCFSTVKEFASSVIDYMVNAIDKLLIGLGSMGKAISSLFKGEFAEAAKYAEEGAKSIGKAFFKASPVEKKSKGAKTFANYDDKDFIEKYKQSISFQGFANKANSSPIGKNKQENNAKFHLPVDVGVDSPKVTAPKSVTKKEIEIAKITMKDGAMGTMDKAFSGMEVKPKITLPNLSETLNIDTSETFKNYTENLRVAAATNQLFGSDQQLLQDEISITKSTMESLISQGLSPASREVALLKDEYNRLQGVVAENEDPWANFKKSMTETMYKLQDFKSSLASVMSSLSGKLLEGANSWDEYAGKTKGAIKETIAALIASGVAALVSSALQTAGMTGPFGLIAAPILAAAAGGLAKTVFNNAIPEFAAGGIVYGDTIARVGEYAGASNNPEVIAPLSKLRAMMGGESSEYEPVRFVIEGDKLVGILNKSKKRQQNF